MARKRRILFFFFSPLDIFTDEIWTFFFFRRYAPRKNYLYRAESLIPSHFNCDLIRTLNILLKDASSKFSLYAFFPRGAGKRRDKNYLHERQSPSVISPRLLFLTCEDIPKKRISCRISLAFSTIILQYLNRKNGR